MINECEWCLQFMKDDIAGELDASDRGRMEAHLQECPACSREKAGLDRTLDHLRELREEPLPRHFFVYEEPSGRTGLGLALRQLAWGWKTAAAGAAAVLLLAFALILSQARLEIARGRWTLALGSAPDAGVLQQEISPEFMDAVRSVVREENRRWTDEFRRELAGSIEQVTDENHQAMRDLVLALELRLDRKREAQDEQTRQLFQTALQRWGRAFALQRQDDLTEIRQALMRFDANDRLQAGQASAIITTLARIADSSNPRGGSR